MADTQHNTLYTDSVIDILDAVQSPQGKESLYQQAQDYFQNIDSDKTEVAKLSEQISLLVGKLNTVSKDEHKRFMKRIVSLETQLKDKYSRQESERQQRLNNVIRVCQNILAVSEGKDFDETQYKSSKFLASNLLISPGHGDQLSELHHRMKPAYKAVLSLRLLDKILTDKVATSRHIIEHYDPAQRFDVQNLFDNAFTHTVILPIMLAAIFQDIGLLHPRLIAMQKDQKGKDLFRLLEPKERSSMLKMSHKYALQYLLEGLGVLAFTSNSKKQRDEFALQEKKRLQFQTQLLEDAISAKLGIGDIIKIPQIYASVVLSTKHDYMRKNLPTAAMLIEQLGQKSSIDVAVAKSFINIVGHFPQGYGISYIPTDLKGIELNSYEFCIVNSLNPDHPHEPICRKATRNLAYITPGDSVTIKKTVNLHYALSRKKLAKINKVRLKNLFEKVRHNFGLNEIPSLVPTYWEPYEYFFEKKQQNLWREP